MLCYNRNMDILKNGTIEEIQDVKTELENNLKDYSELQSLCDEVYDRIEPKSCLAYYKILKENLEGFADAIDSSFWTIYKNFKMIPFLRNPDPFISIIKDFAKVRQCVCEECIEIVEERLKEIDNEIFTFLPKPKDDSKFQEKKIGNRLKRELIYKEFEEKYNIKSRKKQKETERTE